MSRDPDAERDRGHIDGMRGPEHRRETWGAWNEPTGQSADHRRHEERFRALYPACERLRGPRLEIARTMIAYAARADALAGLGDDGRTVVVLLERPTGTADCVMRALAMGIPCTLIPPGTRP